MKLWMGLVLLGVLLACGSCSDKPRPHYVGGNPPPVPPISSKSDARPATDGAEDGSGAADLKKTDGGQACKVDCDCPQGQRCTALKCRTEAASYYCCSKTGCPSGEYCTETDGDPSVCP